MGNQIQQARKARGWSQQRLISELEKAAQHQGKSLPSRETLKARVSRWENNRSQPDEFYRPLLREALGRDDHELGFTDRAAPQAVIAVDDLRVHLLAHRQPAPELVAMLHQQTEVLRRLDRQYGAQQLMEQIRGHVANIEDQLHYAALDDVRRALARLLADAASLAGWQALDMGANDQAWRMFTQAARAASVAEDRQLNAFARMESAQVYVEVELEECAAELARDVWTASKTDVCPALRCWLAAGLAEMLAKAGQTDEARRALALAERLAVDLDDGERPPYLVFNTVHLTRWSGHTLTVLRDPAAEPLLRQALADMDDTFTRAGASLRIDLGTVLAMRGKHDEAAVQWDDAEQLARQIGSRRQLQRLQKARAS